MHSHHQSHRSKLSIHLHESLNLHRYDAESQSTPISIQNINLGEVCELATNCWEHITWSVVGTPTESSSIPNIKKSQFDHFNSVRKPRQKWYCRWRIFIKENSWVFLSVQTSVSLHLIGIEVIFGFLQVYLFVTELIHVHKSELLCCLRYNIESLYI